MNHNENDNRRRNKFPATEQGKGSPVGFPNTFSSDDTKFHFDEAHDLPFEGKINFSTGPGAEREQDMNQAANQSVKKHVREKETRPISQWKVISQDDEWDADKPVGVKENEPSARHSKERSFRDPTAFYRNDTSGFLGELQKAEHLLYEKANLTSKVDFPAPKRKTVSSDPSNNLPKELDAILSDSNVAHVLPTKKKEPKQAEPDKVIVDVNDFVETFSVIGEPIYLKTQPKTQVTSAETSEFEQLLNRGHLKKDMDRSRETIDRVSDSLGDTVLSDIAHSLESPQTPFVIETIDVSPAMVVETPLPVESKIVEPAIDPEPQFRDTGETVSKSQQAVEPEETTVAETNLATKTELPKIESIKTEPTTISASDATTLSAVRAETEHETVVKTSTPESPDREPISEQPLPEPEYVRLRKKLTQSKSAKKHSETTDEPVVAKSETVTQPTVPQAVLSVDQTITVDASSKAGDSLGEESSVCKKATTEIEKIFSEHSSHVCESSEKDELPNQERPPCMPGILERFEKFAADQYDMLAEYIKDKVYDGNRLIAFCGMQRGVGCSTLTLLAARGIMRHGLKTAIIDANFEFPDLYTTLTGCDNKNTDSWVDVLHGKIDWQALSLTPTDTPLLTFFPLAENALVDWSNHEPERLQLETNRLIKTLHEQFDLILLDCGCFEEAFEEITWGELELFQPDGVIFVRNPKTTTPETLESLCHEMHGGGIRSFGVAENFV